MRRDIPLLAWTLTLALTLCGAMRALGQTAIDVPAASTAPTAPEDEFDLDFLNPGLTDKKDRKTIQTIGLAPPGLFTVAVEVNAVNKGSMNIKFVRRSRQENANPCFTAKDINTFQFTTELLSEEAKAMVNGKAPPVSKIAEGASCLPIEAIIQEAFYEYDRGELILKITVPQAALQKQKADRFAPQEFSDGENAGFVNYYANAYHSEGQDQGKSSQFLDLKSGFNIESWQLRQQSIFSATDGEALQRIDGGLSARKVFRDWKTGVLIGKISSQTPLIPGLPVAGLSIYSDEGLMPPEERMYNPSIKGYARSNARIQARQNGLLFLERNVPPGPFDIDELRPPSSNGDIQVTVTEADGSQQVFITPYANTVGRMNPGSSRYLVNLGSYDSGAGVKQTVLQASLRYGLSEKFTGALDFLLADRYQSYASQFDWENMLGSQLFNINVARYAAAGNRPTYSLMYQDRFKPLQNIMLSYSLSARTEDYRDPAQGLQYAQIVQSVLVSNKITQALSASLDLGSWGSLGLAHSVQSYWASEQSTSSTQLSYGKSVFGVNLNANLSASNGNNGSNSSAQSVSAYLGIYMPISLGPGRASVNGSINTQANAITSKNIYFQNNWDNGVGYGLGLSGNSDSTVASGNVQIAHDWGNASASISQSSLGARQLGLGNNGSLVFHRGGLIAGPPLGETFGIIEVPDGAGARVHGQNSKVGASGFGVASYLSPYTNNTVQLTLDDASLDLDIGSPTQNIAPMAGAIVRLKYDANRGIPLLVDLRPARIKSIPIGAEVIDEENNIVGMVGQGSRALLRVKKVQGELTVAWGDGAKDQCRAAYQITPADKPNAAGLIKFILPCIAP